MRPDEETEHAPPTWEEIERDLDQLDRDIDDAQDQLDQITHKE